MSTNLPRHELTTLNKDFFKSEAAWNLQVIKPLPQHVKTLNYQESVIALNGDVFCVSFL